jgi:RNA polymerase sigma factor (TIGR02999 family)
MRAILGILARACRAALEWAWIAAERSDSVALVPLQGIAVRIPGVSEDEYLLPEDALARLQETSSAHADVRRIASELLPVFYEKLRSIAKRTRSRLGGNPTMQTTALVHEAYLRLGQSRSFVNEAHFLHASALAMRHALINYAQARVAEKRGGGGVHVTLSHMTDFSIESDEGLLALNDAMHRLAVEMPRSADVVECRFFGGFGEEETAKALGISLRTVQRDWLKARAWLYRELGGEVPQK